MDGIFQYVELGVFARVFVEVLFDAFNLAHDHSPLVLFDLLHLSHHMGLP